MKINYLSCFVTKQMDSGNKAAVVQDFIGTDGDKQALATKLNLPVTVFIEKELSKIIFRFFYPATEMSMCNHGSLAAAAVLLEDSSAHELKVFNKDNRLIHIKHQSGKFFQEFGKAEVALAQVDRSKIEAMLNITADKIDPNLPCLVASVGSPKLLVPLKLMTDLDLLKPDFEVIKAWSIANQVNGLYVYTADSSECDFYARAFNPRTGNYEDAATGVAAGALLGALGDDRKIKVGQGKSLGRPSMLIGTSVNSTIAVGGKVVFDECIYI